VTNSEKFSNLSALENDNNPFYDPNAPVTKNQLEILISDWRNDSSQVNADAIIDANVSQIIDMSFLFYNLNSFNLDISGWDVSNVTDMSYMFYGATSFNQDISGWDISNVTNSEEFATDSGLKNSFNPFPGNPLTREELAHLIIAWAEDPYTDNNIRALENADVSEVIDMSSLFVAYREEVDEDCMNNIGDIDECTLTYTYENNIISGDAFFNIMHFSVDISRWDVSNVSNMNGMFMSSFGSAYSLDQNYFNVDIGAWDVSSVKNMSYMFWNATSFNQDISGWDVSNVDSMDVMFYGARSFNQDISGWDVSNVTNSEEFAADSVLLPENMPTFP